MDRSSYIGGSDAKRILDGDWLDLYLEKIGEKAEEDLSHSFPVQLGLHTEAFHMAWLNKFEGFDIVSRSIQHEMSGHPFIKARLDGWDRSRDCFVEVKHSNGRASREQMVEWYQPQVAHYCNVLGTSHGIVSYIAGNSAPDWFKIEPSLQYRQALLDLELAFWWHVEHREAPAVISQDVVERARTAKASAGGVRIDDMRAIDMTLNNEWAVLAIDYTLNEGAASNFEKAKKGLKALVEADVRQASGHGVCIKRSKTGALLFSNGA
jgi:predicted phage-related endonuclease